MQFKVTTDQRGPLAIHELLQRHANELWIPTQLTSAQAVAFVLDQAGLLIARS